MDLDDPFNFNYIYSCNLKSHLRIKIGTLEGKKQSPDSSELCVNSSLLYSEENQCCSELVVECVLYADGHYITLPITTSYKSFTTRWNWNEWLTFPIQFCHLPRNTLLLMTIYDYIGPRKKCPIGGTTISLFDKHGLFRRGLDDLRVWPGVVAHPTDTPGKGALTNSQNDQMHQLNKLVKKHESGQIAAVDWLDRLVFREIELINDKEKRLSDFMYLMIEFPKATLRERTYHILWWETKVESEGFNAHTKYKYNRNCKFNDPELGLENLHESKHHHLARSLQSTSDVAGKDVKPNSTNRDLLFDIILYPPTKQLTSNEQDLVWKYRYYLSSQKKGLAKFLRCVNWDLEKEAKQALNLLYEWTPADAQDALELLGPDFTQPKVRRYAVECLNKAKDDELLLYLLQLVQALKYETLETKELNVLDMSHYAADDEACLSAVASEEPNVLEDSYKSQETYQSISNQYDQSDAVTDLASFLIQRSCSNDVLANYLYWYLVVECEDTVVDQELKVSI